MQEIADEIIKTLERNSTKAHVERAIPFVTHNFHKFKPEKGRVAFIDGGNAEILGGASFSLQFFRIFACVYDGELIGTRKKEFYALIYADEKLKYKCKFFGIEMKLEIDSMHPLISNGARGKISKVADIIRRKAEVSMASEYDLAVLDGNLREDEFVKIKGNIFALSKTNEMFTDSGNSLCVELMSLSPYKRWYYHPIARDGKVCIARLNENSKYVFKIESKEFDEKIVRLLSYYSSDPVFLGYPYGLVKADKFARVSNNEKEYLKIKFMSMVDKDKITQYLNTTNAHSILDNIL